MKSEKEKKIIESNINIYLREGLFKKGNYEFLTEFYVKNSEKSLITANIIIQASDNIEAKKVLKLSSSFESYIWSIVCCYYSMFYAVNSLFSKNNIKIGDKVSHKVTSDVFYFYFIKNNKIANEFFKIYEEARNDAMALTKYTEIAENLHEILELERDKRHKFQYDMTIETKRAYAMTSIKRAKEFLEKIKLLI